MRLRFAAVMCLVSLFLVPTAIGQTLKCETLSAKVSREVQAHGLRNFYFLVVPVGTKSKGTYEGICNNRKQKLVLFRTKEISGTLSASTNTRPSVIGRFSAVGAVGAIGASNPPTRSNLCNTAIGPVVEGCGGPSAKSDPDEWKRQIDFCWNNETHDAGETNCALAYGAVGAGWCVLGGGRKCLIAQAAYLASHGSCAAGFTTTLVCQCHNPEARQKIQDAGPDAVCSYVVSKVPGIEFAPE
jgi:hypothetical protein